MTLSVDVVSSTREDPHAQARAARSQPVLLHSMSVFREMFAIVFANRKISTVVEVGVESGQVSSIYTELGAEKVYCIDPFPTDHLKATLAKNPALELVERPSPAVLGELPPADLYVLDGDHNYAVVRGELDWLLKNTPDAVIAMHDVLWPWSRRDLYYEPSPLAPEDRHEPSSDGPTMWHDELSPAGFVGLGSFTVAREAGGERNGVLTAVEDAIAAADEEWIFVVVPAVFGMGVLVRKASAGAKKILDGLRPYTSSRLLGMLENNRLALYTRVLEMQYEAVAHADDADRLSETIAAQRYEIERLHAELAGKDAEIHSLREEIKGLRDPMYTQPATIGTVVTQLGRVAAAQVRKARH